VVNFPFLPSLEERIPKNLSFSGDDGRLSNFVRKKTVEWVLRSFLFPMISLFFRGRLSFTFGGGREHLSHPASQQPPLFYSLLLDIFFFPFTPPPEKRAFVNYISLITYFFM